MQRMRLLQPEKFLSALIQTLIFKDHANLADILRKMHSAQEASQYKPFHNQSVFYDKQLSQHRKPVEAACAGFPN